MGGNRAGIRRTEGGTVQPANTIRPSTAGIVTAANSNPLEKPGMDRPVGMDWGILSFK
jgi:hypothetical protein